MLAKHFSAVAVRTLIHISALWVIPLLQLDKNVSNPYWKCSVIWQLFEMRICMLAPEMFWTLVATTSLSVRLWFCLSLCLKKMILHVSLPPQLWNLHMTVAPLFLFKSGSPWYLHQGTQTCSTCWDFISWLEQHVGCRLRVQFHFHRTVKPDHRQLITLDPSEKVKHMIIVLLYRSNQYSLNRAMNKSTH